MKLIKKWKDRETKKKLREENKFLKAQILSREKLHVPIFEVEKNIQTIRAEHVFGPNEENIPKEVIERLLLRELSDYLHQFVKYDFYYSDGHMICSANLNVAIDKNS